MNKYAIVSLSVAGGILSGLAWTGWCSGLVLLIALVPFFLIENYLYENQKYYTPNAFFTYILPGIFIFAIIAIGWMRVASLTGAICVISGLTALMSLSLWLSHMVRLKTGNVTGFISLFAFWLGYEYLSLNVSIISPWLNLGNGLSKDILFIQWYELTGTAGGTVWILLSNLLLSAFLVNILKGRSGSLPYLAIWLIVIIIPSVISVSRYHSIDANSTAGEEVVIIQPNIDPYTTKFTVPFVEQLSSVLAMAEKGITDSTVWVLTPETTVDDPVNIDALDKDIYTGMIRALVNKHPKITVVAGLVTFKLYPSSPEAPTISARRIDATGSYYDHFNSALKIDAGNDIGVYHKSKLVPGIEMQFSNGPGRFLSKILPSLGGTKWGYGIQKDRGCFERTGTSEKIAPIICYESVFGSYVADYVKNGANALFIITNDGWWKNTNGYKQHLSYASIRAIETRRPVARAGNTGVSCLIDIRGKRTAESGWWTKTVIKGKIFPETMTTVYVKYGDYILKTGSLISILLLITVFAVIPLRKKIRTN